ncbi:MAG: PEP/pyruvate-binding domain-containing protein [Anaerolineales bacterium]
MPKQLLVPLQTRRPPSNIGNKAHNLRRLAGKGFRVPPTIVCTWEAYERYRQDDPALIHELSHQLANAITPEHPYAIRSSANIEDSRQNSYAGQFISILDVCGLEAILQAIWSIWSSVEVDSVHVYQQTRASGGESVKMAVLIQDMVTPLLSGVAFSKNPMTGTDEVLVEAVRGPGSLLVQDGVTPLRWVNKWGTWLQQADSGEVDLGVIEEIVHQTRIISQEMDSDVDLEWVFDGQQVYWVQMRDITSISNLNIYSNRISREVLPGQIKPLIWSINTRLINQVWVELIDEAIGPTGIDPGSLTKAFYYRTYFNMGTFGQVFNSLGLPRESLEIMMGIVPAEVRKPRFRPPVKMLTKAPRLLAFFVDKLRFSRQIERFLPQAQQMARAIPHTGLEDQPVGALLVQIDRIAELTSQVVYFNIVGPLLNSFYHSLLIRQLKSQEVDYKKLDLTADLSEIKDYDPNYHLAALHEKYRQLSEPLREQALGVSLSQEATHPQIAAFQGQVRAFMDRFGHFSDSGNDFSSVPWRERPEIILGLVANYQPIGQEDNERIKFEQLGVKGIRGRILAGLYRRARQYSLYREQISSLYTYSYGLFRPYYLALGGHLVSQDCLQQAEDIFWLYNDEVRALLDDPGLTDSIAQAIAQRRAEMRASEDILLPEIIYGEEPPPILPKSSRTLVGTATSPGYYSGSVKVIRGLHEFAKMEQGDVLVVPFSDVGWTPLFAKAGAVIADSGGMLSHSSIIAREYNIPAVVSIPGILKLADGTRVSVDGFKGEILIHENES